MYAPRTYTLSHAPRCYPCHRRYLPSGRPLLSSGLPVGVLLTYHWPVPCTQYTFKNSGLTEIAVPASVVEIGIVCTTPARHTTTTPVPERVARQR